MVRLKEIILNFVTTLLTYFNSNMVRLKVTNSVGCKIQF